MVAAPTDTPVTTPLELTVATAVLLLLQVPPEVAFVNVVPEPTHIAEVPLIAETVGEAFTVTVIVETGLLQPEAFLSITP